MLPVHFLKRHFPKTPDWLLGGLLLMFILWIIVLPIETFEIAIRREYIPTNFLAWIARFLYMWGYAISLFSIAPLVENSSLSNQLGGAVIVLFGVFITSPVYFIIGALLTIRKDITIALGILLTVINIATSCFVAIWMTMFLFSG